MTSGEDQPSFDELVDMLVSQAITSAKDRLRTTNDEPGPGPKANGKNHCES
jgi:hypothetical protein